MALHPEVQQRAQAEIDAVVGGHRLPEFSDREFLPYVNAIVKETMRWQNVTPLSKFTLLFYLTGGDEQEFANYGHPGVAHATTEDNEYDGYFIPKGSIVIGSTW